MTLSKDCINCEDCKDRSPLFTILTKDELNSLGKVRYKVHFKAGEVIFKQGAACHNILSIRSGFVKIYLEDESDKKFTIKISGVDELIGKTSIFLDKRHPYSVAALTDVDVCFIDAVAFKQVLFNNRDFGEQYANSWGASNALLWNRILSLAHKQMNGKIADVLMYLAKDVFCNNSFDKFITSKLIAEMSGVAKDNVVRTLSKFHKEKIIRFLKEEIAILNMERLEEIAKKG